MLQTGQIKYYVVLAEKLKQEEKVTMFIDFSHLLNYRFDETGGFSFVTQFVKEYHRFEVYLRKGLTQFMSDLGHSYAKDHYLQLGYYNMPSIQKIRDLKVHTLGRLMSIHGTVTRTTEVKPELLLATFKCLECGVITQKIEQQFKFTEPVKCSNDKCNNRTKWELLVTNSVFLDW
jgi:DNA replication licensing factor MCM6